MDHDAMNTHVNKLKKWKEEVQPILDFVKEMMPQTDEEKAEFAHMVERRRQAREAQEAELLGTDKADGLRAGQELDTVIPAGQDGESDPNIKKEASESDDGGEKVGMQGDPIKPADEAIKAS